MLFLVNPVCARDLCLLNRVKYDSSLISLSASWQVNSFSILVNYLFYAVTVFIFFELVTYAVRVSKNSPNYVQFSSRNEFCINVLWKGNRNRKQMWIKVTEILQGSQQRV